MKKFKFGTAFSNLDETHSAAFVDADNVKKNLDVVLTKAGLTDAESQRVGLDRVLRAAGVQRYFLYSAVKENQAPEAWIQNLRQQDDFIFRTTRLKEINGKKKQEGVDVKLAIEAIQLAHRGKLSHAVVFSDDGDLIPLIDALVSEGIYTAVAAFSNPELGVVAPRLRDSSDSYLWINPKNLSELVDGIASRGGGSVSLINGEHLSPLINSNGQEFSVVKLEPNFVLILKRRPLHTEYISFKSEAALGAWFKLADPQKIDFVG